MIYIIREFVAACSFFRCNLVLFLYFIMYVLNSCLLPLECVKLILKYLSLKKVPSNFEALDNCVHFLNCVYIMLCRK